MMGINFNYFFVFLIIYFNQAKCAKILGVFSATGFSQYIIGSELLIPLAEKGHDVTVISMHETKGVKNYKHVLIEKPKVEAFPSDEMFKMRNYNMFKNIDILYLYAEDLSEKTLADKNVQKLIHSNETFDLVICETILNEALFVFASHFKAKLILLNTMGMAEYNGYLVGNPIPPSFVPIMVSGYTSYMNFYERARNTAGFLYDCYKRTFDGLPTQQKLVDKYFPKKYDLQEAIAKADLLIVNGHYSVTGILPLTHAVKEVAGFHVRSKPLPEDIKKFLDGADKGAILFSLGSNLKSSEIAKPVLEKMVRDFGKLEQRILWKFEAPNLDNKPKNVMISKWLPQVDIIAHPNVVAFISHGGLLSKIEATYYGVPVIGVPIFADQLMNVRRMVDAGNGIYFPFDKFTDEGALVKVVKEVVNNPKYKENAKARSRLLLDRVVPPLEEALFWVEHVLKHNNTNHLRSPILELTWYQVYSLDVAALFIGILVVLLVTIVGSLKLTYKIIQSLSQVDTRSSIKKNK